MKISIYELLGLIKKGIAPKKIKVTGNIYIFDEDYNFYTTQGTYDNSRTALGGKHGEINLIANAFNKNVEILIDKELEEIPIPKIESIKNERILRAEIKINELIRKIKKIEKSEKDV